jgi:NCS1 family nucleobase:cation symporter-1
MIADYYFIRKQQLSTVDLYKVNGQYTFRNGFNYCAIIALLAGIVPNIPGFLTTIKVMAPVSVPAWIAHLYNYAWFVGFFISALTYLVMMRNYKPLVSDSLTAKEETFHVAID